MNIIEKDGPEMKRNILKVCETLEVKKKGNMYENRNLKDKEKIK